MIERTSAKVDKDTQSPRTVQMHTSIKSTDIKEVWVDRYGVDESVDLIYTDRSSVIERQVGKHGDTSYHLQAYIDSSEQRLWSDADAVSARQSIEVVQNAAALLEHKLRSRSWKCEPITLSGNIDCYHPIERKVKTTRALLELFVKYKHPVRIITKNTLILRDMDLLVELAKHDLLEVCVPVATLHRDLHRALEPSGAELQRKMQMVKMLSTKGISVTITAAPIVPGLNDEGIFTLVKVAAAHGATAVIPTVHPIGGAESADFKQWARRHFPYRWRKVVRSVEEKHRAIFLISDRQERMRKVRSMVTDIFSQFQIAANTYGVQLTSPLLNTRLYNGTATPQMSFF